jgi:hypothetical protein
MDITALDQFAGSMKLVMEGARAQFLTLLEVKESVGMVNTWKMACVITPAEMDITVLDRYVMQIQKNSYGRGGGQAAKLICDGGKEMDAGLCYNPCRTGFTGKGPVCWGTPPAGYHSCGMGVAINESVCSSVTESQVQAVAELIAFGATMGGSGAAKVAIKDATRIEEGEKAASITGKFFKSLESKLKELNDVTKPVTKTLDDLKAEYKNFLSPEVKRQIKAANFTFAAGNASLQLFLDSQQNLDEVTMLALIRDLASLTSLVDPSPVSDVISAYAYPAL